MPSRDRQRVTALATDWLTGARADEICREAVIATFLDANFGGDPAVCASQQQTAPIASEATRTDQYGVEGVHAASTSRPTPATSSSTPITRTAAGRSTG